MNSRRSGFELELTKLATVPPLAALRMPRAPVVRPGTFGIKDAIKSASHEVMTRPRWAQTMIDLPVSVGAMALGYGLGRLATDAYIANTLKSAPGALKYVPAAAAAAGALATIGMQGIHAHMRARRAEAAAAAGEEQAPPP